MNLDLVLSIAALLVTGYCLWQIFSLNRLRKVFFSGAQNLDLESILLKLEQELATNQNNQLFLEEELSKVKNQLSFAVQKVGLVRFNPFEDGGGNFSFALAVLDEHDSGLVLTSMHGRQQNRVYTKKIEEGKSDSPLTEEEQKAIEMANSKLQISNTKKISKSKR